MLLECAPGRWELIRRVWTEQSGSEIIQSYHTRPILLFLKPRVTAVIVPFLVNTETTMAGSRFMILRTMPFFQ